MTYEPISPQLLQNLAHSFGPSSATTSATSSTSPTDLFLSDFPSTPLAWLWPGRIPLGHLTLLDAAPNSDPSLFALHLAASISTGSPLPGVPTDISLPPSTVLLFAPYDSPSATLKPRLEAAAGDPSRVLLFRPPSPSAQPASPSSNLAPSFTLPRDLPHLAATIRRHNTRLVILDPATAIPGLARSLPALIDLAQQTNCAILLIRTLHTPVLDPLHAPCPSSPLLEASASRLLLTPDPENENHHLLLTTRHRLCPPSPILTYDLHISPQAIPTLHALGERDLSHLSRLSTAPLHSPHRQAILHFLQTSTTPQTIPTILNATSYDHEAGRKMLIRMKQSGELLSPARGLYTTPHHPSLSEPHPEISPVPIVPTVPTPLVSSMSSITSLTAHHPGFPLSPTATLIPPVPTVPITPLSPRPDVGYPRMEPLRPWYGSRIRGMMKAPSRVSWGMGMGM